MRRHMTWRNRSRYLRRSVSVTVLGLLATVVWAPAASAEAGPAPVVHSERVKAGPYDLQVSFSDWPLYAGRSLDMTFQPTQGIKGRTARLHLIRPSGGEYGKRGAGLGRELPRYTRSHDRWGLDATLLPDEGTWKFDLALDGPEGKGRGTLAVSVGPRPGPPIEVSWAVGLLPGLLMVPIGFTLWWRGRGRRTAAVWTWD
ncbi:hypothetical protein [Streptomyces sp. NPDC047525]|uniref:hypothetical protein n=1 Tax=Streptomyces sp. NPDC047525 TaxID=3155264 RepID=UPI003411D492